MYSRYYTHALVKSRMQIIVKVKDLRVREGFQVKMNTHYFGFINI